MSEIAYASGASTVPLLGQTIGENLGRHRRRHGDREALVVPFQDVRLTYAELGAEVDRVARGLLALGLRRATASASGARTAPSGCCVQYATAKVGVILVNINPAYRTHEVQYALAQSGCRVLVAATDFKTSDYRAMVAEVRPELPDLEHVVFLGTPDWDDLLDRGAAVDDDRLRAREAAAAASTTRSTSSTRAARPASRRAPRSATTTS